MSNNEAPKVTIYIDDEVSGQTTWVGQTFPSRESAMAYMAQHFLPLEAGESVRLTSV